jgi:hypothetical protein
MKIRLVTNYDDWEGLYVDGKLVEERHTIRLCDLAKAVGLDYEEDEVRYEWLAERGSLPGRYEDVQTARI